MAKKLSGWKTKGMNKDLSVSAFSPEFAFENVNLRLATNDGNTLMSWVNERSTESITLSQDILGTPIGTATLNHKLVLFTTEKKMVDGDHIYVISYSDVAKTSMTVSELYNGNLGFSTEHPLETHESYESETVQKVYWTDGINQPRVINIADTPRENLDTQFDFVNELELGEKITVVKELGASGMFAPGVIQYAFTYYHKYGQETNIFYTSPLLYISHKDRGASPEDKVENAFRIQAWFLDTNFDYLRIYSIHRTSLNAEPICKRIQDIAIEGDVKEKRKATYIDTGLNGDSITPTELLYKGGESIIAKTMEQKDNTLFLGNIRIDRPTAIGSIEADPLSPATRSFNATQVSSGAYEYANQLTSVTKVRIDGTTEVDASVPCAGFKFGDIYRCGVQFQYKTGKWSDPVWLEDFEIKNRPSIDGTTVTVPTIQCTLPISTVNTLITEKYKRVRAVAVFPNIQDRVSLCQGVVCPTIYTDNHRGYTEAGGSESKGDKDLYAQSSWFFRTKMAKSQLINDINGSVAPKGIIANDSYLEYTSKQVEKNFPPAPEGETAPGVFNPQYIKAVEIQGEFEDKNKFQIDSSFVTFNSPDIEFDTQMYSVDFNSISTVKQIGNARIFSVMSDIDIQTETPSISDQGGGFIHKSFTNTGNDIHGIVSGLFYDDFLVDDSSERIERWPAQGSPVKFMVYAWNKSGSLNNDITRPADKGTQTAQLKKKVISNLRYTVPEPMTEINAGLDEAFKPQLFSSNEATILKFNNNIYQGNVDTMLVPDGDDGVYFAYDLPGNEYVSPGVDGRPLRQPNITTDFTENVLWKTYSKSRVNQEWTSETLYYYIERSSLFPEGPMWKWVDEDPGDFYRDLAMKKGNVRMKYKSTPHLAFKANRINWDEYKLPVLEIMNNSSDDTRFGGRSTDALKENVWLPCGEPERLVEDHPVTFYYSYGDTYYQRYDCLKTYAFTPEDPNQIVEIGSFMLETRTNIDGRYDRNRGQQNNLNMSPQNFNLINPVYSQLNNFFSYRIQDDDYYSNNTFPNQVTWSLTKTSGADVDMWTNVNLGSILELDGNNGKLNSLQRFNDILIAFQDSGVSQILYNESVQVSATSGVPIEIANSGKVQGKRYYSNVIGCSNKWSVINTPMGIYFMDSNEKSIYLFNGQLQNISSASGFNSWTKTNIPEGSIEWTPEGFNTFVSHFDRLNQDVLFTSKDKVLAFSEKFGVFTSFYDYGYTPFFCNLDDTGIWVRNPYITIEEGVEVYHPCALWKHQGGDDCCRFFGSSYPYSMILVGNPEPQTDKMFTNLEFRASVEGEGDYDPQTGKFTPALPFNYLETWDEYQHGITTLSNRNGHSAYTHYDGSDSSLKRKFRIWRCDIPRDNAALALDEGLNITRFKVRPVDRMRNPWLYLKLMKNAVNSSARTEIHDIVMTYYN